MYLDHYVSLKIDPMIMVNILKYIQNDDDEETEFHHEMILIYVYIYIHYNIQ